VGRHTKRDGLQIHAGNGGVFMEFWMMKILGQRVLEIKIMDY